MKIKKGDTVKVLYGKDAGKTGKVLKVFVKLAKVVVDGVNVYKRHMKGDGKERQSAIVPVVKPLQSSKVMLVCPKCGKTTRVSITRDANGKAVRICKKCGKQIDEVTTKTKTKEVTKEEVKAEKTEKKTAKKSNKISKEK